MVRTLKRYIATDNHENLEYVEISCLSTDTKPVTGIINGSIAQEVDTGKVLFFNEFAETWVEQFAFGNGGGGTVEKFVITLTPTALDYSGSTDKTMADIAAAYAAGKQIVGSLTTADGTFEIPAQFVLDNGGATVPYFLVVDDGNNLQIIARPSGDNVYTTAIYALTPAT